MSVGPQSSLVVSHLCPLLLNFNDPIGALILKLGAAADLSSCELFFSERSQLKVSKTPSVKTFDEKRPDQLRVNIGWLSNVGVVLFGISLNTSYDVSFNGRRSSKCFRRLSECLQIKCCKNNPNFYFSTWLNV